MRKELADLKLVLSKAGPYFITDGKNREEQKERYDDVVSFVNELIPIMKRLDKCNLSIKDLQEFLDRLEEPTLDTSTEQEREDM